MELLYLPQVSLHAVQAELPFIGSLFERPHGFQEKCLAAGLDYDDVLNKSAVWQAATPAASGNAAAAKQDDEEAKPAPPGVSVHINVLVLVHCIVIHNIQCATRNMWCLIPCSIETQRKV